MFLKKHKSISVVLPNNDIYDVFHTASFKVLSSGALQIIGYPFDSKEKRTYTYATGAWCRVYGW